MSQVGGAQDHPHPPHEGDGFDPLPLQVVLLADLHAVVRYAVGEPEAGASEAARLGQRSRWFLRCLHGPHNLFQRRTNEDDLRGGEEQSRAGASTHMGDAARAESRVLASSSKRSQPELLGHDLLRNPPHVVGPSCACALTSPKVLVEKFCIDPPLPPRVPHGCSS
eukprot:760812-Hanusia_phi.AAC.6